jgi:hypothetical protein
MARRGGGLTKTRATSSVGPGVKAIPGPAELLPRWQAALLPAEALSDRARRDPNAMSDPCGVTFCKPLTTRYLTAVRTRQPMTNLPPYFSP